MMVAFAARSQVRSTKPAKPARGTRRGKGTRKASASPAKPTAAASAPAEALDWGRITLTPCGVESLERGTPAVILKHRPNDPPSTWEGTVEAVDLSPDGGLCIQLAQRGGGLVTIRGAREGLRAMKGTPLAA